MKAFTLVIGALIGIAASAVVLNFQLALSPYFGFLVLVGVGFWLNDVRRSPQSTSGPNWRSFFTGAAVWIGLGIGALLYRNWLARVPANAVSPSAMGAALLVFGIAFVTVGVYAFRSSPSPACHRTLGSAGWSYADLRNVHGFPSIGRCNSVLWCSAYL